MSHSSKNVRLGSIKDAFAALGERKSIRTAMIFLPPIFILIFTEWAAGGLSTLFTACAQNPLAVICELMLISAVYAILVLLTRRPYLGFLIALLPFLGLGIANCLRYALTSVPLTVGDIAMAAKMSDLMAFTGGLKIAPRVFVLPIISALLIAVYALTLSPLSLKNTARWLSFAAVAAAVAVCAVPGTARAILSSAVTEGGTTAQTFRTNGYIPCLLYDMYSEKETPSVNSDAPSFSIESIVPNLKPNTSDTPNTPDTPDAPDSPVTPEPEVQPDIIIILSEAFWDPSVLENISFSDVPCENFAALKEESTSGHIISSVYGGQTCRPEFEVLTGTTTDIISFSAVPHQQMTEGEHASVASYLGDMGYRTVGLHTFKNTFYDRHIAYPALGFDTWLGLEDAPYEITYNGGYVEDKWMLQWIQDTLDSAEEDEPTFIFAITMENHGPYEGRGTRTTVTAEYGDSYREVSKKSLNNYISSVERADNMLGELTEYLENRERPAVLVFWGDHLPYLGGEYCSFVDGGVLSTGSEANWTEDDLINGHAVPFLVWSTEDKTKEDLGYLSPYFLGGLALEKAGIELDDFYTTLSLYRSVLPVDRTFIKLGPDGKPVYELDATQSALREAHRNYSSAYYN